MVSKALGLDHKIIQKIMSQNIVCRGCRKNIKWIKTKKGKDMPVDPAEVTIVTEDGETKRGFIPHWATCPKANTFRKKTHGSA